MVDDSNTSKKRIFSVRIYDEERFYENTSGLGIDDLFKVFAKCEKPFVEMGQYGDQISCGDFAAIQQGSYFLESVEFNVDNGSVLICQGGRFEQKEMAELLVAASLTPGCGSVRSACGLYIEEV